MSSGEEDMNDDGHGLGQELKKRRIQRACDICRRKKIRCDGGQMPNNRCSNCIAYNLDCTYVEAAKKRGPPKGYVETLENRLENMEKLLQRLCPDADFTQELGSRIDRDSWSDKRFMPESTTRGSRGSSPTGTRRLTTSAAPLAGGIPMPTDTEDLVPSDDEIGHATLTEGLKRLAVEPLDRRFHGKSSGVMLVQAAMNLKKEFSGADQPKDLLVPPTRRPEFWAPHPWELISEEHIVRYVYPPDDLIPRLVDNYFVFMNPFLPVLHRPSFERALNDRRHHTDIGFGSVVMLVCAIGALWTEDTRVYIEGMSKHSSGWKWFEQVQVQRKSFLGPPRLYDLQIYALSAVFLHSSSSPQSSWTTVGIGIRVAQDVGAHRRKVYNAPLSVESELWKRAFWVLVAMDRFSSAALGRPCAIQDEDFDLELPLEVDDDYWEHPDPAKAFKQPPGLPCGVAYFNSFLKLNQILAFALRTIYSINKSKILLGFVGPQWEQHIVAELDSALNKWIDTVPDHLRWDPHRENFLHFSQSATLYATYYQIQILIHRPFIPSPRKPSPLTFPSLAICTNAARSCSHVLDIQRRRGSTPMPHIQIAAFTAGIVLLLNIWGAKKSGGFADFSTQMVDVHKCMDVLRCIEERWISAGRLWDILNELASVGELPGDRSALSNKRERGADSPLSTASSPGNVQLPPLSGPPGVHRPIAGRRSIGSTPTLPPSSSRSPSATSTMASLAATQNGLPYGSRQLASGSADLGGIPSGDMGMPWLSHGSSPANSATPASSTHGTDLGPQTPMFGGSSMPNLNIFDLFQADASQMFNMPMLDQNFSPGLAAAQPHKTAGSFGTPEADVAAQAFGSLAGVNSVNEALQMWSSAPAGFESVTDSPLDDWNSYLNNIGTADTQHHAGPSSKP